MLLLWIVYVCLFAGLAGGQQCYVNNCTTYNTIPPSTKVDLHILIAVILYNYLWFTAIIAASISYFLVWLTPFRAHVGLSNNYFSFIITLFIAIFAFHQSRCLLMNYYCKGGVTVRIGTIMSGTDVTSESLVRWAAHRINSNPSILPNVSLEVYLFNNYYLFDIHSHFIDCLWGTPFALRWTTLHRTLQQPLLYPIPMLKLQLHLLKILIMALLQWSSPHLMYAHNVWLQLIFLADLDHGYWINHGFVCFKGPVSLSCEDYFFWILSG